MATRTAPNQYLSEKEITIAIARTITRAQWSQEAEQTEAAPRLHV
jgi:hypothetical protein